MCSEGCESGHADGVNKALGIDAESDNFIHEIIRDEDGRDYEKQPREVSYLE